MGSFTDKIKGLFSKSKNRSIKDGSNPLYSQLQFLLSDYSNRGMSEDAMLDAFHENPMLYSCVSLISTAIADTDIHIERNGVRETQHSVLSLLEKPNKFHSKYSFMWLISAYLLILGKVYVYILPDGSLIPIPPTKVTDTSDGEKTIQFGNITRTARIDVDLIMITMPDMRQPYTSGTSYGAVLSQEVDISEAAASHEAAYLQNHARPDLIVNYSGLSSDQVLQIDSSWKEKHEGSRKSGKPSFSNADNITIKEISSSFKDLGLKKLREFSSNTIRETFGIPPELLGNVQNSNRSTIDAAEYIFKKNVVSPKLNHILNELSVKLLPLISNEHRLRLASDSIVPDDKDFKFQIMKAFPGSFSINEARRLAGEKPIIGGDTALEGNMQVKEEEERKTIMPMRSMGSMKEQIYFKGLLEELNQDTSKVRST